MYLYSHPLGSQLRTVGTFMEQKQGSKGGGARGINIIGKKYTALFLSSTQLCV